MLSNKQIKSREIYKTKQELIKATGELKKVQQDYLLATNEVALCEFRKDNKLKQGVIALKFKSATTRYFKAYGRYVGLQEQLSRLTAWKAED